MSFSLFRFALGFSFCLARLMMVAVIGVVGLAFSIYTHDAWGVVPVGRFESLEEARQAFGALCQDPWYRSDGTVKGLELAEDGDEMGRNRLAWFPLR